MAVQIDERLAGEVANIAQLLEDDEAHTVMKRLVKLASQLVPGCDEAVLTVLAPEGGKTVEVTDLSVRRCHEQQFTSGRGPAVEVLKYREPRRIDDTRTERRWPRFCRIARGEGLLSYLALPVSTGVVHPAATFGFYSRRPAAFADDGHDIALLLAAQGGTVLHNTEVYDQARLLIGNLQKALQSRAVIEQAKGILMDQRGCDPDEAFQILVRASQNYNIRLREIAGRIVRSVDRNGRQIS